MTSVNEFLTDGDGARGMAACHANQSVANAHEAPLRPCMWALISPQPTLKFHGIRPS